MSSCHAFTLGMPVPERGQSVVGAAKGGADNDSMVRSNGTDLASIGSGAEEEGGSWAAKVLKLGCLGGRTGEVLDSTLGILRASGRLSGWAPELITHPEARSESSYVVMRSGLSHPGKKSRGRTEKSCA